MTPAERRAVVEECALDIEEWAAIRERALTTKAFRPAWLNRRRRRRIEAEIYAYRNAAASIRELSDGPVDAPPATDIVIDARRLPADIATLLSQLLAEIARLQSRIFQNNADDDKQIAKLLDHIAAEPERIMKAREEALEEAAKIIDDNPDRGYEGPEIAAAIRRAGG